MNPGLQRAELLIEQERYDLAERELRMVLAQDVECADAHRMLAICLCERKAYDDAEQEADAAVRGDPEDPRNHLARGYVLYYRRRLAEAHAAFQEAVRLDPAFASALAFLAQIAADRRQWKEALATAEQTLEIDPEHLGAVNLRSIALRQLGRGVEAGETVDDALARRPDDAVTHANRGWALLHEGRSIRAAEHFREALRLEPNLEWARLGILEAMKARNILYRWLLRYFLFIGRFSSGMQMSIGVGAIVGVQVLNKLAKAYPAWAPYIYVVLAVYVAFALSTWLASPLFNALLWFDRFGRLTLSDDETHQARAVVLMLASSAALMAWAFVDRREAVFWFFMLAGINWLIATLPLSAVWRTPLGWPRRTMRVVAGVVLAIAGYRVAFALFLYYPYPVAEWIAALLIGGYRFVDRIDVWAFVGAQLAALKLQAADPER